MNLLKTLLNKKLLVVCIFAIAFSLGFISLLKSETKSDLTLLVKKQPVEDINFNLPVRLKIPQINVDSTFEYVGLAPDGSMAVPKGPLEVGWYNLGPYPGSDGSAVVAGHSGWKNGISAVFDNLYKLNKGDKVYVEDEKGTIITFMVREIRKYKPKADAKDVFYSSDGKAHLNLITCTGIWNIFSKSRSDRLVVFTDKE